MLEPVSRRWAWPTLAFLLAFAAAPASAEIDADGAQQAVEEDYALLEHQAAAQARHAHGEAMAAAGPVLPDDPGFPEAPGSPQGGPPSQEPGSGSQGGGASGGSGGPPPSGGGSRPPSTFGPGIIPRPRPVQPPVALPVGEDLLDPVRDLLPDDPIGMARDTAEQAQALPKSILEPEPAPSSDPEPQGQPVAAPQGPSALVATAAVIVAAGAATAATFFGFWLAGSSGAVGSKAAAGAASRVADLRRLLPLASPLFTRFERDTVLGNPRREALYALILQEPGISLQALGDATGLSRTAVIHHLRLIERQHLIVSRRVGRSRHYFENGGRYGHDQKEAYAVLQNGRSKAVAEFIKGHPGSMQKALCEALGIQPSIAHWHVRRLEEAKVVETVRQGRTVAYFPGPGFAAMQANAAPAPMPAASAEPATTA